MSWPFYAVFGTLFVLTVAVHLLHDWLIFCREPGARG